MRKLTEFNGISQQSPWSRDSIHILKFPKFFSSVEKNRFEVSDFST